MAHVIRSLTVQARVIYAVMSRELRVRHASSPVGVFSALAEPLGQLLLLTAIFTYLRYRHASIGGYVFNLSTRGYGPGTYTLDFAAGTDPTIHKAVFAVR